MSRGLAVFLLSLPLLMFSLEGAARAEDGSGLQPQPAPSSDSAGADQSGPGVQRIGFTDSHAPSAKENYECLSAVLGPKQAAALVSKNPQANFCGVVSELSQQLQ